MVHILKIDWDLIPYVYKLFPSYRIVSELPSEGSARFIVLYDITFVLDMEKFKDQYTEAVIISNLIAEEIWTKEVILNFAVARSREWKISRRRKPTFLPYDFEASFNHTLFGHDPTEEYVDDKKVLFKVFDAIGTSYFKDAFFEAAKSIPGNRLVKAIKTFLKNTEKSNSPRRERLKELLGREKENFPVGVHVLDFVRYVDELGTGRTVLKEKYEDIVKD